MITNTAINFIYQNHGEKITKWNHSLLSSENLQAYADVINEKGAALDNCFGFVDGTVAACMGLHIHVQY